MTHRHRMIPHTSVFLGSVLLLSLGLGMQAAAQHPTSAATEGLAPTGPSLNAAQDTPKVVPTEYRGDIRDLPQVPDRPRPLLNHMEPVRASSSTAAESTEGL